MNRSIKSPRQNCVTLATLLALLQERDRVFIVHSIGSHMCEDVAGGTVKELRSMWGMEVCGESVVEAITMDTVNEWPKVCLGEETPILLVTIGGKEAEA